MSAVMDQLFERLDIHPILVEVGATGPTPIVWNEIARHGKYIGLGRDAAVGNLKCRRSFYHTELLEDLIVPSEEAYGAAPFHVAQNSIYSSLLLPNPTVQNDFLARECSFQEKVALRATTLNAVVERLSLPTVDWLYINVNGVDVPIFKSLKAEIRNRVLAVDVVMYLVDLRINDREFGKDYTEMIASGFWLSRMYPYGFVRMRPKSLQRLTAIDKKITEKFINEQHRLAPNWVFVRYFRTLDSMKAGGFVRRDYVLLWSFAIVDWQIGYAADVMFEYERIFGADDVFQLMRKETTSRLRGMQPKLSVRNLVRKYVPMPVRNLIRRVLFG